MRRNAEAALAAWSAAARTPRSSRRPRIGLGQILGVGRIVPPVADEGVERIPAGATELRQHLAILGRGARSPAAATRLQCVDGKWAADAFSDTARLIVRRPIATGVPPRDHSNQVTTRQVGFQTLPRYANSRLHATSLGNAHPPEPVVGGLPETRLEARPHAEVKNLSRQGPVDRPRQMSRWDRIDGDSPFDCVRHRGEGSGLIALGLLQEGLDVVPKPRKAHPFEPVVAARTLDIDQDDGSVVQNLAQTRSLRPTPHEMTSNTSSGLMVPWVFRRRSSTGTPQPGFPSEPSTRSDAKSFRAGNARRAAHGRGGRGRCGHQIGLECSCP